MNRLQGCVACFQDDIDALGADAFPESGQYACLVADQLILDRGFNVLVDIPPLCGDRPVVSRTGKSPPWDLRRGRLRESPFFPVRSGACDYSSELLLLPYRSIQALKLALNRP